jgi:hypothetical protein
VTGAARLEPRVLAARNVERVWYAAYGSNMNRARFEFYLTGGKPPNGARSYPGCRDTSPPRTSLPIMLPGQSYFALESLAWTGGMAFYDHFVPGPTAARAYSVSLGQLSDIAAQEMYRRTAAAELDLTLVLRFGHATFGDGRYETLVYAGELEGWPVLTFTAPWHIRDVEVTRPSAHYLKLIADGLAEAHGWTADEIAEYLAQKPGARGQWGAEEIRRLVQE